MISMVEKTILAASLLVFCSTLSVPAYSKDCLDVNAEKLEGDLSEAPDDLHYESWINEGTNENTGIYYFGRCIKNNLLIHESPLTDALFLLVSKSDEVTTT